MRLCKNCYKRMLSFTMIIPVFPIITGGTRSFEFTREHEECENCCVELVRFGYDPCLERLEFYYDIAPFGKGRILAIRLFGFMVGHDAVSEEGNYLMFLDSKLDEFLDWWH